MKKAAVIAMLLACAGGAWWIQRDGVAAAREHFAYAGLSMGSIYAYTSIIPECLDLFAWFGFFSGI